MLQGQVNKIYEILFSLNNAFEGTQSQKTEAVRSHIQEKISTSILKNEPITLVLPAFPAKSPNREKTIGSLPDFGEALALQRLHNLCTEIKAVYSPGATVVICSDGRVFNDLVGVSDEEVDSYKVALTRMVKLLGLENFKSFDLDDIYSTLSFSQMREKLEVEFSDSVEIIRAKVKNDPGELFLFNGIHRFIFEDRLPLALSKGISKNRCREEAKEIAYKVVQRSQAWSKVVEEKFPGAVRLSIHPQLATSTKIPVRLLPGDHQWRTPWHGVVLRVGEQTTLTTHKRALEVGAKYQENEVGWGYFEAASW